jgi:hypothetical protein
MGVGITTAGNVGSLTRSVCISMKSSVPLVQFKIVTHRDIAHPSGDGLRHIARPPFLGV